MSIKSEEPKNLIPKYLEVLALITGVSVPVIFVLGHVSAYFFFSSFSIDYLSYTDTKTAFSFALESPQILFGVLLIAGTFILYAWIFDNKNNETAPIFVEIFSSSPWEKIIKFIFAMTFMFWIIYNLTKIISSVDLKNDINDKRFIPHEVSYGKENKILKCVTSAGSLGQFQVFIDEQLQPFLISESKITYIKPLFAPVPDKLRPYGKESNRNTSYDKELKIWLNHWKNICGPSGSDYKVFEFNKISK